jgi:hypothetical protein
MRFLLFALSLVKREDERINRQKRKERCVQDAPYLTIRNGHAMRGFD